MPAAAQEAEADAPTAVGSNMVFGGSMALVGALPPLLTGMALYGDTGGFISGRSVSPIFFVPGGVSAVAGITLIAVGAARGSAARHARSRQTVELRVSPNEAVLRGAF